MGKRHRQAGLRQLVNVPRTRVDVKAYLPGLKVDGAVLGADHAV